MTLNFFIFKFFSPELTRLWNICGDNLEACRLESRDFLPTIDTFFVEAFKELDPEPPSNVVADPSKREVKTKTFVFISMFNLYLCHVVNYQLIIHESDNLQISEFLEILTLVGELFDFWQGIVHISFS